MSKGLFVRTINQLQQGGFNLLTDALKQVLVNYAAWGKAITAASNATPIVITATAHGYANGDTVIIKGVLGNTAANGKFIVANVTANTFELTNFDTGANVAGNGAYTSGGFAINMSINEFLSDIPGGARISTSGAIATGTRAIANGAFQCEDVVHASVTGSQVDAVLYYKDTGSAATSRLIFLADDYTNLPYTPNGSQVTVDTDQTGTNKLFRQVS